MAWINTTKPTTTWVDNIKYLVSQALNFLMTQDGKYLITNQSLAPKPTTTWADNIEYLVSHALEFLMTQDGEYLITNQSLAPKPDGD